ncbi:hypothetical protein PROFUN_06958 [Planoprotostelium fungivorum]|uniref:Uncharacterized protein n=1 Tax=Planoprotostelium fungivorum TaxID=1890364 RepID=A0A2P6NNA8_9EUKA|nr:hypothetical protein PROFUN_06958 [Planoprotostelium fungivorum]
MVLRVNHYRHSQAARHTLYLFPKKVSPWSSVLSLLRWIHLIGMLFVATRSNIKFITALDLLAKYSNKFIHVATSSRAATCAAIFCDDAGVEIERLTYQQLLSRARSISHYLKSRLNVDDRFIGLITDGYSAAHLSAMLGILLCGRAFVPLTTSDVDRMRSLCVDHRMTFLVQSAVIDDQSLHLFDEMKERGDVICYIDEVPTIYTDDPSYDLNTEISYSSNSIAYVMHTSGTTGKSKPVRVPHRCVTGNINSIIDRLSLTDLDVTLVASPPGFDPSVGQIFCALSVGGTAVLVHPKMHLIVETISQVVLRHRITYIQVTPSYMTRFPPEISTKMFAEGKVRTIAFGGEKCPSVPQMKKMMGQHILKITIYNLYGITEASIWSSCYRLCEEDISRDIVDVPLGTPLRGSSLALSSYSNENDEEIIGETFVGGTERICLLDGEQEGRCMRPTGDLCRVSRGSVGKISEEDIIQAFVVTEADMVEKDKNDLRKMLEIELTRRMESHSLPDIDFTTIHEAQMKEYKIELQEIRHIIEEISNIEHHKEKKSAENARMVELGCTSIDMARCYNRILFKSGVKNPSEELRTRILNVLLHRTIDEACEEILAMLSSNQPEQQPEDDPMEEEVTEHVAKKTKKGDIYLGFISRSGFTSLSPQTVPQKLQGNLWSVDLSKCVDASPLITLHYNGVDRHKYSCPEKIPGKDVITRAYIGSHSGRFLCVDVDSGRIVWEARLSDRIESTAAVDMDGEIIYIGCYGGDFFGLCSRTGSVLYRYKAGSDIKSIPCIDHRGRLWVGCHDNSLLVLDRNLRLVRNFPTRGAVYSSPCIDRLRHLICVGSHDGILRCFSTETDEVTWSIPLRCPVFSSPCVDDISGRFYVGGCDGNFHCVSWEGKELWCVRLGGALFSSPTYVRQEHLVVTGCHNGTLYGLNADNGNIVWSVPHADDVINGSPSISVDATGKQGSVLACGSVMSQLFLVSSREGRQVKNIEVQGKVFGSTIAMEMDSGVLRVIFGTRDNKLTCIDFS